MVNVVCFETSLMLKKLFFPNDDKADHFAPLDGLRGLAVLLVLFGHARLIGMPFPGFMDIDQIGVSGVHLFFVLSAYLLDRQIANTLLQHKADVRYWLNYSLRRILRIYPLFFLSLLLYCYLTTRINVEGDMVFGHTILPKSIIKYLTLQKGEGFYWSIPVEFKYYFVSPFLMLFCHYVLRWNVKRILLFFVVCIGISIAIKMNINLSKISTINYLPVFLIGTILSIADLLKQDDLLNWQQKYAKIIEIIGWIALGSIIITIFGGFTSAYKNAILWGIVLFSTKYGQGWLHSLFSLSFLRLWGVLSFSAYLLHRAVLGYVHHIVTIPNKIEFFVFLGITLLVSTVSYLLIERPLSRIRLR